MPKPSLRTHRYYRSVVVPAIRQHCGYISDAEAHRHNKSGFFELHPEDPKMPSMANMSQEQASRLIEYAINQAEELGLVLPDPFNGMGVSMADIE